MKTISLFQKSPEQYNSCTHAVNAQAMDVNNSKVKNQVCPDPKSPELPTLPDAVFDALPDFLKKAVARCDSQEEKDIVLLGSLVTLGACLLKMSGIYAGKRVYPSLYLFITAPASAGKGTLVHCKQLVMPVHLHLRQQSQELWEQYNDGVQHYKQMRWKDFSLKRPVKPPEKMLIIPANNSSTGMFQLLSDNDGRGLIFETEGDTLAMAFKGEYSNFSDGFRKAFHHEIISYYRRTDHEYVEIKHPCISAVLSGTPGRVASLIPDAENGLFSRFLFYRMNIRPVWKNVFAAHQHDLEAYFDSLGQEFFPLYQAMNEKPAMEFCLSLEQQDQFNDFFDQVQEKYLVLQGMDYMATIRRLGLIAFRMAMILTALRIMETGDFSENKQCLDVDLQTALAMIRVLIKHSSLVFSELPGAGKVPRPRDKKEQFLDLLPEKFSFQEFMDLANNLDITGRTANRYIAAFCEKGLLHREQAGSYINLNRWMAEEGLS